MCVSTYVTSAYQQEWAGSLLRGSQISHYCWIVNITPVLVYRVENNHHIFLCQAFAFSQEMFNRIAWTWKPENQIPKDNNSRNERFGGCLGMAFIADRVI